ncbi:unnamed protein product [Adineta steineri]|uniref:RRM domain-containing protein n=1 Tax=Adineta steineri TaxID=433720 RepID=A0A813YRT8_9BILA|nr:unnamed protein product [Adineta steineri]CAF0977296.1 unnamed protein product [Adineta steineri]CAF3518194.1 unnamed protein product [Adineta steineri]CAF3817077.1 unnamed protein product [Adineta steineri]
MVDEMEIERMLEEKLQGDVQKQPQEQIVDKTEDKKHKEKKHHKHHKHHKHQKSHKSEKKHERKASRSPNNRHQQPPAPSKVLSSGKRRDVKSDLHILGETLNRQSRAKEAASMLKSNRREKTPELTPEERDLRTVFCMQLAATIRPRDLEDFFARIGKVRDVRLITDPRTRRSKGVAYVEFRDLTCVQAALTLNGEKVLGIPIVIKPSNAEKNRLAAQSTNTAAGQTSYMMNGSVAPNDSVIPTHGPMKLYVGSLHFNITESMLRGIFDPFGRIENITLMKDPDTERSRGYGFIQFAHAEDAKRAMENLNGFELAGRSMKVGHVTERLGEMSTTGNTNIPHYTVGIASAFASGSNLDSDDLDHRGISLGPTGRLALMAKLSEGSGLQMPKNAMDALQAAHVQAASSQHVRIPEPPNSQQLATCTAVSTQCFMLSNMFNPTVEAGNPHWVQEIRDEVIEECNKYGGVVHIYVDEKSPDGNVYVKCSTIASAINTVNALHGRFFSGLTVIGNYIPTQSYHKLFPQSSSATTLLTPSS